MWFETIIREETGCAAYMIGCQGTGQCAVFDPLWDIQPYLDMAKDTRMIRQRRAERRARIQSRPQHQE